MKDLVFSISLRNHTFDIRTTPRSTLCYYHNEGKYTTSLIFASNTYAFVEYKNVRFSGTVTKRNNWHVEIDYQPIFKKRYNRYFYISNESASSAVGNTATSDVTIDYPDKILWLFNQLMESLHEDYLSIENTEIFKDQLCKYLLENYLDDEIEDLDRIVESENWDDVKPDGNPIVETISLKNLLIGDCQSFFVCFRQAELDNKNKKTIITLENVIAETPSLSQIPYELLQKEFHEYLEKNYTTLIKPNIWYYQEEVLMNIGDEIFESCQYVLFISTVEERIDKILSSMVVEDIDKDELYSYFKSHYDKGALPSDEEFVLSVTAFVNDYVTFNKIYKKFVAFFNTDHIKVEWNDENLCLFQKCDEEGLPANPQNLAEYEVYKYVVPFYRKNFFRKNSNRYRPVIEQLPAFIAYGSTVLDILFKHKAIICNGDIVVYNKDGDVELACKEIMALSEN